MSPQNNQILLLFTLVAIGSGEDAWTGKWFPDNSTTENPKVADSATSNEWNGKWFPEKPASHESIDYKSFEHDRIMGIPNKDCDDGETNLATDFDPHSFEHSLIHTCLEEPYKPNDDIEPIHTVYDVPKFYTPVHKCMNETISYEQRIPTLGYHRPLWAAFGEYFYLPPQRWLHNLEHGSIVALYHPCANVGLIDQLKKLVKSCLYRHIITPHRKLTADRPFALAAWGTSLEFSVIDEPTLIDFIRKYAKTGPEKVSRDGQYRQMLTEPSKIIADVDDSNLCPNRHNANAVM